MRSAHERGLSIPFPGESPRSIDRQPGGEPFAIGLLTAYVAYREQGLRGETGGDPFS